MRAIEKLPHGNRSCAILPDLPEVSQIFWRERILKKEHSELLGLLAELHRLVRRQPFMHIVKQFDFVTEFTAADFKKLQRAPHLGRGIKERLVVERLWPAIFHVLRTIARHSGKTYLNANI